MKLEISSYAYNFLFLVLISFHLTCYSQDTIAFVKFKPSFPTIFKENKRLYFTLFKCEKKSYAITVNENSSENILVNCSKGIVYSNMQEDYFDRLVETLIEDSKILSQNKSDNFILVQDFLGRDKTFIEDVNVNVYPYIIDLIKADKKKETGNSSGKKGTNTKKKV